MKTGDVGAAFLCERIKFSGATATYHDISQSQCPMTAKLWSDISNAEILALVIQLVLVTRTSSYSPPNLSNLNNFR